MSEVIVISWKSQDLVCLGHVVMNLIVMVIFIFMDRLDIRKTKNDRVLNLGEDIGYYRIKIFLI